MQYLILGLLIIFMLGKCSGPSETSTSASIESSNSSSDFEQKREEALKRAEEANREIDAAQDAVIDEYRKQAVDHFSTTGAGHIKVETFVMKDGKSVICTTTIRDGGKAVDCR